MTSPAHSPVAATRPSSIRPAALLVLLAAAAGAGLVAAGDGVALDWRARGEGIDAVRVEVGQHPRQRGHDCQPLLVADRGRRRGGVVRVDGLAAGQPVEVVEDLLDPVVVVQPAVPGVLAQRHGGEEAQRPVLADVEFVLVQGFLAGQFGVFGQPHQGRDVDDIYQDPYSAKRGFWFSHIGWMLKNYPSGHYDYKNIPDLKADPVLVAQDKYYALWILLANIGLPALFGWMVGDIAGTLVLAGLLRLVLSHHFTFFINSLCHMFGTRPYTDTNTARDNPILAIFTWGEGYHNYHHFFQYDYRNGVKWWQYDPSKWIIYVLSKIGLTWDLKRIPDVTIQHAQTEMAFKLAEKKVATFSGNLTSDFQAIKDRLNSEQQAFKQTIAEWQALKTQAIEMKKNEFAQRIHEVDDKLKDQFSGIENKLRNHAQQIENLVNHLKGKHV